MWCPIILLFVLGIGKSGQAVQKPKLVKVTVFFEYLCPDSAEFFVKQLIPTYEVLKEIMEVKLYAYGIIDIDKPRPGNQGYTFLCQHHAEECYGNMMFECGKKYIHENEAYLRFAFCFMGTNLTYSERSKCARQVGACYYQLEKCSYSTEGEVLLHEAGIIQNKLEAELLWVPWITINDESSKSITLNAERNLMTVVCSLYEGETPQGCLT